MPLKLSLLSGSRPKSAWASPQQCTQSAPDVMQIGSLSAELYSRTREHRQIAPEGKSNFGPKPSLEPNNNIIIDN